MSDLIERLKGAKWREQEDVVEDAREAADEIERLRKRLKEHKLHNSDLHDEIEQLEAVIRDTISSLYAEKAPYYQIHFDVADMLEAALEDSDE
jgi:septal ring factor EnvC (AmiA/AmiB activator)